MKASWICTTLTASGLLLAAGMVQAGGEIRTGMWETTITSEVEGMPFTPPPMSFTDCITREDLVPNMEQPDQNCDVMEHEIKGSVVSWRMRCSQDGMTTSGQGQIRYQGDSSRGEMSVTMSGGPMGEMKMRQTLEGRRLGDCR